MSASTIMAYCDGSGTHDPKGPACVGVLVLEDGRSIVEASSFVGFGTNQRAELCALGLAISLLRQIYGIWVEATVYSDSEYAIGAATEGWYPKAHTKLVMELRNRVRPMRALRIEHVHGHSGNAGNDWADYLAGRARVAYFAKIGIEKPKKKVPAAPWWKPEAPQEARPP